MNAIVMQLGGLWAGGLASIALLPDRVGAWPPLAIWATMVVVTLRWLNYGV